MTPPQDPNAAAAGTTEQPAAGATTEQPAAGATAEQPAAGATTEQPAAGATAEQPARVVPEAYSLTLPEGAVGLDQSDVDEIAAMAKAAGLTNAEAQAELAARSTLLQSRHQALQTELASDPDVGGAQLETHRQRAARALDQFAPAGTPKGDRVRAMLTKTGAINDAGVVWMLSNMGAALGEDAPPRAQAGTRAKRDPAEALFGDTTKQG